MMLSMLARSGKRRQFLPERRGFTLVEMMVIIVVVGIMAAIATPPMFRFVQSNRLQTGVDRMAADLQYARSLAVANSEILRFSATPAGYQVINPVTGVVIRDHNFEKGMSLGANQTADFYPWGMADARIFNLSNGSGARQLNLLPTGIVEVH
jgi:prepilin-type N-terminal cleavage/methylation domain-containing protein